jgi:hypothetical protein
VAAKIFKGKGKEEDKKRKGGWEGVRKEVFH